MERSIHANGIQLHSGKTSPKFLCPCSASWTVAVFPEAWVGTLSWLEATAKPEKIKKPSKKIAVINFLDSIYQLPPAVSVPGRSKFNVKEKLKISNINKIATIILSVRDLL
jgi:hypothetical protein